MPRCPVQWRPVVGYEGRYMVSDTGWVFSVRTSRYLRTAPSGQRGYPSVTLYDGRGSRKTRTVHVLMLEAFVGPAPDGCYGLHNDDVPTNNVLSNLRWGTQAENMREADMPRGLRHYRGKLSDVQVERIRNSDAPAKVLALEMNVGVRHIFAIRSGEERRSRG